MKCPSCETDNWADVMVMSNYCHFMFIPLLPLDKDAVVICKKCGLKRMGLPFSEKFFPNFLEIKRLYRHPWFTSIVIGILSLPFLLVVLVKIIRAIN